MDDFGNDLFTVRWNEHSAESLDAYLAFLYDGFVEI